MKKSKKAFTLLEVLLAMAILICVSGMVMEGFMSTLKYSSNSAIYAHDGAKNSSSAYETISSKAGVKDPNTNAKLITVGNGTTTDYTITVNSWSFKGTTGNSYAESGSSKVSNRYAITYTMPVGMQCTDCGTNEFLARDKYDTANNYRWFCTKCGNYI